jgi:hypothetical protein
MSDKKLLKLAVRRVVEQFPGPIPSVVRAAGIPKRTIAWTTPGAR